MPPFFDLGHQAIPYCGTPTTPGLLLSRWNVDPVLIAALVVVACLYAVGAQRSGSSTNKTRQAAFYTGWLITALAVISPLCPLSVSLFAARVSQHLILLFVGAPLVAIGQPFAVVRGLWSEREGEGTPPSNMNFYAATIVFTVLMWFWHAPLPYEATFDSSVVYWTMHLSLYGSALWLWMLVLTPSSNRGLHCLFAAGVSSLQMGFLGAIITFSPRALYAPHALTTFAWGLTPLQDQQLGGAILWVPGMLIFMVAAVVMLWVGLNPSPTPSKSGVS